MVLVRMGQAFFPDFFGLRSAKCGFPGCRSWRLSSRQLPRSMAPPCCRLIMEETPPRDGENGRSSSSALPPHRYGAAAPPTGRVGPGERGFHSAACVGSQRGRNEFRAPVCPVSVASSTSRSDARPHAAPQTMKMTRRSGRHLACRSRRHLAARLEAGLYGRLGSLPLRGRAPHFLVRHFSPLLPARGCWRQGCQAKRRRPQRESGRAGRGGL